MCFISHDKKGTFPPNRVQYGLGLVREATGIVWSLMYFNLFRKNRYMRNFQFSRFTLCLKYNYLRKFGLLGSSASLFPHSTLLEKIKVCDFKGWTQVLWGPKGPFEEDRKLHTQN